jgi:hypothetical protein
MAAICLPAPAAIAQFPADCKKVSLNVVSPKIENGRLVNPTARSGLMRIRFVAI